MNPLHYCFPRSFGVLKYSNSEVIMLVWCEFGAVSLKVLPIYDENVPMLISGKHAASINFSKGIPTKE
ncbi:hypothetical protein D3C77_743730 [compost metagenome]